MWWQNDAGRVADFEIVQVLLPKLYSCFEWKHKIEVGHWKMIRWMLIT